MLAGQLRALHLVSARKAAAAGWEKSPQGLLDSLLCWFGDGRGPLRAPRRRRRLLGCTERVFGSCLARRVQEFYTSCDRLNGFVFRGRPIATDLRKTLADRFRLLMDIGGCRWFCLLHEAPRSNRLPLLPRSQALVSCQDGRELVRPHDACVRAGAPPSARPRPTVVLPEQHNGLQHARCGVG